MFLKLLIIYFCFVSVICKEKVPLKRASANVNSTVPTYFSSDDPIKILSEQNPNIKETREAVEKEHVSFWKSGIKVVSRYLAKSLEKFTNEADEALAEAYALGDISRGGLADTTERMDYFCNSHKKRVEAFQLYVKKKFAWNIIVKLTVMIVVKSFNKKMNIYCANKISKEKFIKNAQEVNELNNQLTVFRDRHIDVLLDIQKPTFKKAKLENNCCSYWRYKSDTLNEITNKENKEFVEDMINSFFSEVEKYLCYYHPKDSESCNTFEFSPPSIQKTKSIFIELLNVLSKMTAINPFE